MALSTPWIEKACIHAASFEGGSSEGDGGSDPSTANDLPRWGVVARVTRCHDSAHGGGETSLRPQCLVLNDGRNSVPAFLSSDAPVLAGCKGRLDDGCIVAISEYTVSTVLQCVSCDISMHQKTLGEIYGDNPPIRQTRNQVSDQLFLCLQIQGPITVVKEEDQGPRGSPVDIHSSVPLRGILIDQRKKSSDCQGASFACSMMEGEDPSHALLIRRLEACHCWYQMKFSSGSGGTGVSSLLPWPWESRLDIKLEEGNHNPTASSINESDCVHVKLEEDKHNSMKNDIGIDCEYRPLEMKGNKMDVGHVANSILQDKSFMEERERENGAGHVVNLISPDASLSEERDERDESGGNTEEREPAVASSTHQLDQKRREDGLGGEVSDSASVPVRRSQRSCKEVINYKQEEMNGGHTEEREPAVASSTHQLDKKRIQDELKKEISDSASVPVRRSQRFRKEVVNYNQEETKGGYIEEGEEAVASSTHQLDRERMQDGLKRKISDSASVPVRRSQRSRKEVINYNQEETKGGNTEEREAAVASSAHQLDQKRRQDGLKRKISDSASVPVRRSQRSRKEVVNYKSEEAKGGNTEEGEAAVASSAHQLDQKRMQNGLKKKISDLASVPVRRSQRSRKEVVNYNQEEAKGGNSKEREAAVASSSHQLDQKRRQDGLKKKISDSASVPVRRSQRSRKEVINYNQEETNGGNTEEREAAVASSSHQLDQKRRQDGLKRKILASVPVRRSQRSRKEVDNYNQEEAKLREDKCDSLAKKRKRSKVDHGDAPDLAKKRKRSKVDHGEAPEKRGRHYLCRYEGCQRLAMQGGVCARHGGQYKRCSSKGCKNIAVRGGVCIRHGAKVKRGKYKRCSHKGCNKYIQQGGFCVRHGAKVKLCSYEGCQNKVVKGGVCVRHGAQVIRRKRFCSHRGCFKKAIQGGVCKDHGARVKLCSHKGCKNGVIKGGLCIRHGAQRLRCIYPGCTNHRKQGGLCAQHGARLKYCKYRGCTNQVINNGLCVRHGAKLPRCKRKGCTNRALRGGVCIRHGAVTKRCRIEGCENGAVQGGVCRRHGAKRRCCSVEDCFNLAVMGGVCHRHGAPQSKPKRCSRRGCKNLAVKGGVCHRHGAPHAKRRALRGAKANL